MKPRNQWAKGFVWWPEDPHQGDDMAEPLEDSDDNDETLGKVKEDGPKRTKKQALCPWFGALARKSDPWRWPYVKRWQDQGRLGAFP